MMYRRLALLALVVFASIQVCDGQILRSNVRTRYQGALVNIYPGDDIQTIVNGHSPGTTYRLMAGTHRNQSVTPQSGDSFLGETGAIMSGATVLSSWTLDTGFWKATGQTAEGTQSAASCSAGYAMCQYPEDLWLDSTTLLLRVSSFGALGSGKWYFDYSANVVWIGQNPSGHTVELAETTYAFQNTGSVISNVTIANIIIEKYAATGGEGAIYAPNGSGWTYTNNTFRYNHATGLAFGTHSKVIENVAYDNGQNGIGGYNADLVTIRGNESYGNGYQFDPSDAAAGMKVALITNSTIVDNYVHDNYGNGIWCDVDCMNVTISANTVSDNDGAGIEYEISCNGLITGNGVYGNGTGVDGPGRAGIYVAHSKNVEVSYNTVVNAVHGIFAYQENRGFGSNCPQWEVENLWVHGNSVNMTSDGQTGVYQVVGDSTYYTTRHNQFDDNTYVLGGTSSFIWADALQNKTQWRAYGQDTNSTITP